MRHPHSTGADKPPPLAPWGAGPVEFAGKFGFQVPIRYLERWGTSWGTGTVEVLGKPCAGWIERSQEGLGRHSVEEPWPSMSKAVGSIPSTGEKREGWRRTWVPASGLSLSCLCVLR